MSTVTQTEEKKPRQSPVPQKAEAITAGALKLSLQEKVTLVKSLRESIAKEANDAKQAADYAITLAQGL